MTTGSGVSFVVPVYNKAAYLPDVLATIRAQRGDFARQYIFVDDGSTDDSLAILERLTAGWPNTVVVSQENLGSAHAANRGIALATQPYIKFVDADDLIAYDATATLVHALEGRDACLAYGNAMRYKSLAEIDLTALIPADSAVTIMQRPLKLALRNSMFNPTQFLVKTECARAVGGCDERIVWSQEYSLTLRLANRWNFLKVEAPVAFLPEEVPGRLSNNGGRQLQRVTMACAYFLRDYPELPRALKQFACRRAAGRAWKYARRRLGAGYVSPWFWRSLLSRLSLTSDPVSFIERCATVYDTTPPVEAAASQD